MSERQETIADIIAEMRALSNPISDGIIAINGRQIADRLEAAHKREIEATAAKCCQLGRLAGYGASEIKHLQEPVGDAAKLREALKATLDLLWDIHNANRSPQSNQAYAVIRQIKAALAAQPRNCDVGVPEERIQRWSKFCKARSKKLPPIHGFEWEDYPYKEGDAK